MLCSTSCLKWKRISCYQQYPSSWKTCWSCACGVFMSTPRFSGKKLFWKQCSGGTPTSATSHLIICYVCPHAASLVIKGPSEPVLEGDAVTLECLYTDSDLNISQVHFEVYSKVSWRKMGEKGKECTWKISRCACHSSVCDVGDFVYLSRSSLLWFVTVPKFRF